MAFQLQAGQRAKVALFKGDKTNMKHFDKYTTANLSTSKPKGKGQDGFTYSNWSYVRFVGKAHTFMMEHVKDGDLIVIESGIVTKENYENKDGVTVYPTSEQIVIFDVGLYRKANKGQSESGEETVVADDEDSDSIPF